MTLNNLLKKESGSGIGVVIYGIVIMLVLSLVSINILNAKIIQDGYDRLRDAVESAAAGSVLHVALENQSTTVVSSGASDYQVDYDPWLQLALGFLMRADASGSASNSAIESGEQTVTNDYVKFDRKKVVTHTLKVLQEEVLSKTEESITDTDKYQIVMIFLEPAYDNNLNKTIDIVAYDNRAIMYDNLTPNSHFKGEATIAAGMSDSALMTAVENQINNIVNGRFSTTNFSFNLKGDANLVQNLQTRPYYFVIIKDFALPTLFGDTKGDNVFVSLTQGLSGSGHVGPMFALQGANTNRRIAEDETGVH